MKNDRLSVPELPGVGLGLGFTMGCLAASASDMMFCAALIAMAAVLAGASLVKRRWRCLTVALLAGLLSMTGWRTLYAEPLKSAAGSEIRTVCRVVSMSFVSEDFSAGRALCVIGGRPALVDISGGFEADAGDSLDVTMTLGLPDESIFTFSDGVVLSGSVTGLHSRTGNFSLLYHLGNIRSAAAKRLDALSGDEAELCRGLLLGMTDGFSMRLERDLTYSGVNYMTAVSGAHITIFITILAELFGRKRGKAAAVISLVLALALMLMFGLSPSVVRAGLMIMIGRSGILFMRRAETANSLCMALFVMELLTPFAAADPALQMSALGVFGAAVLGPALNRLRRFRWERFRALAVIKEATVLSFAAMVCIMPVCTPLFGGLSLAEIPASVALAPFFSAGLFVGVLFLISGLPLLALPLGWIMGCFREILAFFGGIDGVWLAFGAEASVPLTLLAVLLLMAAAFLPDCSKTALRTFLLDILLIMCVCISGMKFRRRIDFVSDGSSGAAVVYGSRSAVIMICGSGDDIAEPLFRLLTRQGITSIDLIDAPQLEYSGLIPLKELTGTIPADLFMLPEDCAALSDVPGTARTAPPDDMLMIDGMTIACAKAGSDISADIVMYSGWKRSAPQTSAGLALYVSSRQKLLSEGAVNIADETLRIELN